MSKFAKHANLLESADLAMWTPLHIASHMGRRKAVLWQAGGAPSFCPPSHCAPVSAHMLCHVVARHCRLWVPRFRFSLHIGSVGQETMEPWAISILDVLAQVPRQTDGAPSSSLAIVCRFLQSERGVAEVFSVMSLVAFAEHSLVCGRKPIVSNFSGHCCEYHATLVGQLALVFADPFAEVEEQKQLAKLSLTSRRPCRRKARPRQSSVWHTNRSLRRIGSIVWRHRRMARPPPSTTQRSSSSRTSDAVTEASLLPQTNIPDMPACPGFCHQRGSNPRFVHRRLRHIDDLAQWCGRLDRPQVARCSPMSPSSSSPQSDRRAFPPSGGRHGAGPP